MAGKPLRRAMGKTLDRYAEAAGSADALAFVVEWLSSGKLMLDLTTRIQGETQLPYHQHSVRRYLEDIYGKDVVTPALASARGDAAHVLVEEAAQLLDDAPLDREALVKAKQQADNRHWRAERFNRKDYGAPKTDVNVNVSLATMHLDALRSRQVQQVRGEVVQPLPGISAARSSPRSADSGQACQTAGDPFPQLTDGDENV